MMNNAQSRATRSKRRRLAANWPALMGLPLALAVAAGHAAPEDAAPSPPAGSDAAPAAPPAPTQADPAAPGGADPASPTTDPVAPAAPPAATTEPPAGDPAPATTHAPTAPQPAKMTQITLSEPPLGLVKLEASGTAFDAWYRETTSRRELGAVIMLHGRDSSPNDQGVVDPLRVGLPKRGWTSFSLPMPDSSPDGQGKDSAPEGAGQRVRAAVDFLKGKNIKPLILLGHDRGARVLLEYLLGQPDPAVRAAVVIDPMPGLLAPGSGIPVETVAKLRFPVLDLRTGRDARAGEEDARGWRVAFRSNPGYRQSVLNDPHRDWLDIEDFVRNRVLGWMAQLRTASPDSESAPMPPGDNALGSDGL